MCQKKVQEVFENIFGKWAELLVRRTWVVFLVSLLVFIALCKLSIFSSLCSVMMIFVAENSNSHLFVTYRRWNELIKCI